MIVLALAMINAQKAVKDFLYQNHTRMNYPGSSDYSYDDTFSFLFNDNQIHDIAKRGLTEEEMLLIGERAALGDKIQLISSVYDDFEQRFSPVPEDIKRPTHDIVDEVKFGKNFDEWVGKTEKRLGELKNLNLKNMETVPDAILLCTALEHLELSSFDKLSNFPEIITELQSLKSLTIRGKYNIPSTLSQLKNLEILNLIWTQYKTLPESIQQITSLKTLGISGSDLSSLDVIALCPILKE